MKFKELVVGQTFLFKHDEGNLSWLSLAKGPWVKTSTRCYRKDTNPFSADYFKRMEHSSEVNHVYRVGSINVEVTGVTK